MSAKTSDTPETDKVYNNGDCDFEAMWHHAMQLERDLAEWKEWARRKGLDLDV